MDKKYRYIKCNLCGADNCTKIFSVDDTFLVKCKRCGFLFLNPIPTEKELRNYYDNLSGFEIEPLDRSPIEYDKSAERLQLIEKIIKKGKLLDVGSGGSNFLYIAKNKGWNTYSLDIRQEVLRLLKKQGIKTIDERKIRNGFFDVITLTQVLEHMAYPLRKLKFYRKKLRDGGIIVIEVPNIESLGAKFLRDKWYFIKNPDHISYFSRKTLSKFLEKAGFEIIKTEYLGATFVTDFASKGQIKKEHIFNLYKRFKLPINLTTAIIRKYGMSDTLRIVARKPCKAVFKQAK